MSSPLIFVRDGRTLPYIPVTTAALEAIRAATPKRRPYAVTTYMALLEFANENRADRVALSQREIVERVGASRSTVQAALSDLQVAGVLRVVERIHGNARIENEYVVIEPAERSAIDDTPARDTGDPRPSGRQRTQEEQQEEPLPLSENGSEVGPELTSAVSLDAQLVAHESAREGDSAEISVTLWGKRVPPGIVQDATRALAHFAAQTAQTIRPYTGAGKPTDDLRLICRAMMDHPEARTMWRRMIDRAVSDPWWNGEPSAGVIFSPRMVQRSLAAARASGLRPVNGHGLTPSGRAIAKLLATDGC